MKQDNPFAKGVSVNEDIVFEEVSQEGKIANIRIDISGVVNQLEHELQNLRELLALGREEE